MTTRSGIDFTYRNGEESGHFSILESLGGGVGMTDYDRDGDLDLVAPGGGVFKDNRRIDGLPPGMFRNDGDWRFTEIGTFAGTRDAPFYSHGAAIGDFDNDGFSDVLITGYGGLVFLINQGDGTYVESTTSSGLTDKLWSSSAAWGDVTGDGNPDLYVAHYVDWSFDNHPICDGPGAGLREICSPRQFNALADVLYRNNGDGTFADMSSDVPLRDDGKGLAVLMADVDLDGRLDVYVANDTVPNFLYRNDGEGRMEDASTRSGTSLSDTGTPDGSMGVDTGDFNLDGRPDLWVTNYERESCALYRNDGNLFFQHVSQPTGIAAHGGLFVGWGTVFFDFDHDGDEDLFVSNGHVIRYPKHAPLRQSPLLFQNEAGKLFRNVAPIAGDYLRATHMGRGVAVGDLDNDGDQDLAISRINETVALLSNDSAADSSLSTGSLTLRLIGNQSSRDAVGTVVTLRSKTGSRSQMRQVKGGGSYASTSDLKVHFGLGSNHELDAIEVRWPSGTNQTVDRSILNTVDLARTIVIRESKSIHVE